MGDSLIRRSSKRHPELRVDPLQHPGWLSGSERLPVAGETVQCAEGLARVVRLLGRTDSGGRLLELTIPDGRRHPFFATAANVLVAPEPDDAIGATAD